MRNFDSCRFLKATNPLDNVKETRIQLSPSKISEISKSKTVEHGENVVGSKGKVWWPPDCIFYGRIVDSFDSVQKMHRILYSDGNEELLNLKKQWCEFVST
ncbi:hepatoma-derived growth factor-related protein 2 [Forsythia ovata]|uniref:Hepatoma-derived growth factor-related protein 2 n=1 Tax=Forsythia ovata TaxID=205694 RepID=A0ABD1XDI0_9LAMI